MNARPKKAPLRAGVIGAFVAHSLSPALHQFWLEHYGIEGTYEALPTGAADLEARLQGLRDQGFVGVNVTVPHKETAAELMDQLDPVAAALAAVNLVTVKEDGALEGRNTDGFGFIQNLKAAAPGLKLKDAPVVVLGAGGTTKAVAHALLNEGAALTLTNRTDEKAQAIAALLGGTIQIIPWAERSAALQGRHLLVNTTSLGMTDQPPLEIELGELAPGAAIVDCVYTPLETELLKAAREQGFTPVDGLGMLIHQARPAFQAWFGVDPAVTDALREHLIAVQKDMRA